MSAAPCGQANPMTENQEDVPTTGGITGPQEPTHEATTPPGNADVEQDSLEKGEEKLGHVEAGH